MDNSNPIDYKTPNALAAIWSMMLPGLGQLVKGRVMPGVCWAILVGGGYFAYFWPGLFLHTLCILDAAFSEGEGSFLSLSTWQRKAGFLLLIAGLTLYIYYRNF